MKLAKINLLVLFVGVFIFSSSCNKWNSEHGACLEPSPKEKVFIFKLLDKDSRINLIASWGARYDSEKVTLLKENGQAANSLNVKTTGKVSFYIPDDDTEALEQEVKKVFYLHLPDNQGNLSQDIDTLLFTYEFLKRNDCPEIWYEKFEIKYNDSLYHSGDYISILEFLK